MNLIRLIIFTTIIPGFVAGYVPYTLYNSQDLIDIGTFKYLGLLMMVFGCILYIWSTLSFLLKGKGTPTIWFAKHLKFLIGEEPVKMVSSGLYKFSRNPMYLGVLSVVFGQSIYLRSQSIVIYTGLLAIFFHLVVIILEEPHLREKYGTKYEDYMKEVPRWIRFIKKTKHDTSQKNK